MSKEILDEIGEEFLNKFTASVMEVALAEVNEKDEKKFRKTNVIIHDLPEYRVHTGITDEEKYKNHLRIRCHLNLLFRVSLGLVSQELGLGQLRLN